MKAADTMGARERSRREEPVQQGLGSTWESTVERGRRMEIDGSQTMFERDRLYLEHGRIEDKRQSLDKDRGRWIDTYMNWVIEQTSDELTATTRRVDGQPAEIERAVGKQAFGSDEGYTWTVEEGFLDERYLMEKLLVYEVEAWEGLVWNRVKEFVDGDNVPKSEKERLRREWLGNCWKRLNTNIRAMDARMDAAKAEISGPPSNMAKIKLQSDLDYWHDQIRGTWQSVIKRLDDDTLTPSASSTLWTRFNDDVRRHIQQDSMGGFMMKSDQECRQHHEMTCRLKMELADVEYRISQGLDGCDQIVADWNIFQCRHSRSKSLDLHLVFEGSPLDFYYRALDALKCNNDVIHIVFHGSENYAWIAETIRDMPSVTSIQVGNPRLLPPIPRDTPLFINDDNDNDNEESLETFLKHDESLARTHNTYVFIGSGGGWTIAVSFVGPSSGDLILRLKHRTFGLDSDATLTVLGTSFTLAITKSLTIDDINLPSDGNSSSQLSFTRDARNNLILRIPSPWYTLLDVQLLDEDGCPYGRPNNPGSRFRHSWHSSRSQIQLDALDDSNGESSG